jgi:hypothetical protein
MAPHGHHRPSREAMSGEDTAAHARAGSEAAATIASVKNPRTP